MDTGAALARTLMQRHPRTGLRAARHRSRGFLLALLLPALLVSVPSQTLWGAEPEDPRHAAVSEWFSGAAEPTVEKVAWSSARVFNVGVHYMGSDESSFARHVCSILQQQGLVGGYTARVIDINSMGSDRARWDIVGQARCRR